MASTWKQLPDDVPNDGITYWVRLDRWFSRPFQLTWDVTDYTWKSATVPILMPWYEAPWWKPT